MENRNHSVNHRSWLYRLLAFLFHAITCERFRILWALARADVLWHIYGINGVTRYLYNCPIDAAERILARYHCRIGKEVVFKAHLNIEASVFQKNSDFSNLTIGDRCLITREVYLDLTDKITIEDEAVLSPRVMIMTHHSVGDRPMAKYYPTKMAPVRICRGAWICADAKLLAGVTIGEFAVVAAGSVVNRDVEPYTLVAGLPAKRIKAIEPASRAYREIDLVSGCWEESGHAGT
jgi:acetyltransferase-like isoleucine patch superfamily enzyme